MARPLTLKFFKSDIIRKKIEALPEEMREPIRRAMANTGDMVVDRAKQILQAQLKSNRRILLDSIRWEWVKTEDGRYRAMIAIGPSGEYLKAHNEATNLPRWFEFGTAPSQAGQRGVRFAKGGKLRQTDKVAARTTPGQPARPFLFPAWRQLKKQARTMIADAVNRVFKSMSKKG